MGDDDLIRRGDALALQDSFMGVVHVEKIAAIPAVTPGVKVKPTDAQVASACMSYRHDFGLLDGLERTLVLHQARDWLHAWQKELDLTPQPSPDVAGLDKDDALARFTDWFRKNYPGPDTIIHKPDWHAPRIFGAALAAMEGKP